MKSFCIRTSEDKTFKIDLDIARQSQTTRTMLDDLGIEEDNDSKETIVTLANNEEESMKNDWEKKYIQMYKKRSFQNDCTRDVSTFENAQFFGNQGPHQAGGQVCASTNLRQR